MSKSDRERLLESFKKNKRGRSIKEAEELLGLYGFVMRAATKEQSVWHRGSVGLTLPNQKTDTLLIPYVSLILRKIREAENKSIPEERPS